MTRSTLSTVLAVAALGLHPFPAVGQEVVDAVLTGVFSVSGAPADTGTVVLHRVTPEEAAALDSVPLGPGGDFSFTLPNLPIPGSGETYFAAVRFDGILYPGAYVTDPVQLDSLYTITAYPTREAPPGGFAFPISQREIWINEGPLGWQVTDVLEIQNGDTTTIVPAGAGSAVWQYPLPPAAIGARVLQVGPSVGSANVDGTILVASNALLPAENYYIVQYDLESLEFDVPMPGQTALVQLLVREPAPALTVAGLAQQPTEEIEVGATFLRWAGRALQDQNVTVRLGEPGAGPGAWFFLLATLSLVLVGVGSLVVRRRPGPALSGDVRLRKDILVDIARLDEEYTRLGRPGGRPGARYSSSRAKFLEELGQPRDA